MMGAHVLEQARLHATPKLVIAGTVCAYPKFTPVPFREDDLWNGYPEETNAPYGVAKKTILVGAQAYREQYGTNAIFLLPVEPLRPGRQLRPRRTPHVIPALIRKMIESRATRSCCGATARRRASSSTSTTASTGSRSPPSATTAPSRSTSARGSRRRSASSPSSSPRPSGFDGRDHVGHVDAERPAAPQPRHVAGRDLFGLTREHAAARRHRAHRRLVPRRASRDDQRGDRRAQRLRSRSRRSVVPRTRSRGTSSSRSPRSSPCRSRATVALFFSVNHNGWLTYQGGDQIWLVTSGWLLGQGSWLRPRRATAGRCCSRRSRGSPGSSSVELLPLTTVLQVGVLGPIATLAVYDIGARIAGRLARPLVRGAFVAAPFAAIPFFVDRYHDRWIDQFLPQALGLTQLADFPSVVARPRRRRVVACARSRRARSRRRCSPGRSQDSRSALKPANALFLAGPALAFLLARRCRSRRSCSPWRSVRHSSR